MHKDDVLIRECLRKIKHLLMTLKVSNEVKLIRINVQYVRGV